MIDPVALQIGPLQIHWYGIMYLLAFLAGYFLIKKFMRERGMNKDKNFLTDLIFAILLGVILGGRVGYALFYNLPFYIENPIAITKIWEGGMSFHGGLIGVVIALAIFAKTKKIPFYTATDLIIPAVPFGIALGRIGNFINGELYGRITGSNFCMVFPSDPENCRYPSQLIEFMLEGILLFLIIFLFRKKIKTEGVLSWLFMLCYGIFRFIGELFREPDAQIGYIFRWMTIGQIFSIVMICISAIFLIRIWQLQKKHL